jgi:hypothetical protein
MSGGEMEVEATRGAVKRKRPQGDDDLMPKKVSDLGVSPDHENHVRRREVDDDDDDDDEDEESEDEDHEDAMKGERGKEEEPEGIVDGVKVGERVEEEENESGESEWQVKHRKKNRNAARTPNASLMCDYPVLVEDAVGSRRSLKSAGYKLCTELKSLVGTVQVIKQLSPKKMLIGCFSPLQQRKVAALKKIGDSLITTKIPVPTVDGVVAGVPLDLSDNEVATFIKGGYRDGASVRCPVARVQRLQSKDGNKTKSVRVTFEMDSLPDSVRLDVYVLPVRPYVAKITRCFRCQRLGHVAKFCHAQAALCSACGGRGHKADTCKALKRRCVNCLGDHSAAYKGCPALQQMKEAARIRAETYMPKSQAIRLAKKATEDGGEAKRSWANVVASKPTPVSKLTPNKDASVSSQQKEKGSAVRVQAPSTAVQGSASLSESTSTAALIAENKQLKEQVAQLTKLVSSLMEDVRQLTEQIKKSAMPGGAAPVSSAQSRSSILDLLQTAVQCLSQQQQKISSNDLRSDTSNMIHS